jgi:hypothetical protein
MSNLNRRLCFQDIGRLQKSASHDAANLSNMKQHCKDLVTCAYGSAYTCMTQYPCQASIRALSLHITGPGNLIARWAHGSKLSYFVSSNGLNDDLHERIKSGMKGAADHWRTTGINVSFEETLVEVDAVFLVELDPKLDTSVFAKAFFPGDDRQVLDISPVLLEEKYEKHVDNILCHELGHVLGLRHEFQYVTEQNIYHYPAPMFDHDSIMNCENVKDLASFTLSNLDRVNTHRFYDLPAGPHSGFTIKDCVPQVGKFKITKKEDTKQGHTTTEEEAMEEGDKRWLRHKSRNWSKWYNEGAEIMVHLGISYPGVAWDVSSPYQTR